MAKTRLNTDDALRNIIGKGIDSQQQDLAQLDVIQGKEVETPALMLDAPKNGLPMCEPVKDKLIQVSFYITEKHRKALKMRVALGDKPEDKDQSSIVRAALDIYLSSILQSL